MTDTSTIANKGLMSRLRRKQKELMASSASGGVQPHTDSGFNPAIPTIAGTAAGLGNNVDAIYSFVANNIEFIPVWGVQKGALGCLIDGAGNAFDQSALLVALLQAAGYNAQFLYGSIQLNVTQLDAWLNTTNPLQPGTCWTAYNLLGNGGYTTTFTDGTNSALNIPHVWVQVDVTGSGNWYVFDPSMKTYNVNAGQDLATIAGYNATNFQNACLSGTTQTNDYVQGLNTAGLQAQMQTMHDNVQSWLATNKPNGASLQDLIGGRTIVPVPSMVRQSSLSYQQPGTTPTPWTVASGGIPPAFFTTLRVQYDNSSGSYAIDHTFNSHDLATARLTLLPNSSGQYVLKLDSTQYGISTTNTAGQNLVLTPTHPFTTSSNLPITQTIIPGNYYLIGNAWGSCGPQMGYIRRQLLNDNITAGGATADDDMIGESLNTLFHHLNAQGCAAAEMIGQLNGTISLFHHQIGMVGHNPASTGGPLTDLGGLAWLTCALDNNYALRQQPTDLMLSLRGISFESGTIAQVPGVPGVSTNTVLDAANLSTTITLAGTIKVGNTLSVTITDAGLGAPEVISFTNVSGSTVTSVAANIVSQINADGNLAAINVKATSAAGVITILSGSANPTTFAAAWSGTGVTETATIATVSQPIYVATSANWLTNVKPNLTGYAPADLSTIESYVNGGQTVIVHQHGSTAQNQYTGYGYYVYKQGPTSGGCRGIITGGLNGGGSSFPQTPADNNTNSSINRVCPEAIAEIFAEA
jgi:hypothetical protein